MWSSRISLCTIAVGLAISVWGCKKPKGDSAEAASMESLASESNGRSGEGEEAKDLSGGSDDSPDSQGQMVQDSEIDNGFSTYVQIPALNSAGMLDTIDETLRGVDSALAKNGDVGPIPPDLLSGWKVSWCEDSGCSGAVFQPKNLHIYKGPNKKPDPDVWEDQLRHVLVHIALGGAGYHGGHHDWMKSHGLCYIPEKCKGTWQPMSE